VISSGMIATIAGGGSGDSPAAPIASLTIPQAVAKDKLGNLYIADSGASRVHMIAPSGSTTTVAGTGIPGYSGDNGAASAAQLNEPGGLAVDSAGALYIADPANGAVRKVSGGVITTIAGPAIGTPLGRPNSVAVDSTGNVFVTDPVSNSVLKVSLDGSVSAVAGTGAAGYNGDSLSATVAELYYPTGVAVDAYGNLYIADSGNERVRKVTVSGIITTIAGTGTAGDFGDGGPATAAQVFGPLSVSLDSAGNIYIGETNGQRVRAINSGGIITTIAGDLAFPTICLDNCSALDAPLEPQGVTADTAGNVFVADTGSYTVRLLTPEGGPAVLTVSSSHTGSLALGSSGQYTLTVSNTALAGPTDGTTVTVTELPPTGMSVSSMSGNGWSCSGNSCTRTNVLPAGQSDPTIDVSVNISNDGPSQLTNQVTVAGGGAAMTGTQDLTVLTAPATTIQTNPTGMQINSDGFASLPAPQTQNLYPGIHVITVSQVVPVSTGTQYALTSWSDGCAASHTIDVTAQATTYIADFQLQYQLITGVFPANAGTVNVSSGTFFNAGSTVSVTATGNSSYTLVSWGGADLGMSNPASITMNSPLSISADFGPPGFTCAITGDTTASVADVQQMIKEALGLAAANDDLNRDGTVNIADIQKVIAAALKQGCLY